MNARVSVKISSCEGFKYPPLRQSEAADVIHGTRVGDPYRWLAEESGETHAWIAAQGALTTDFFARLESRPLIRKIVSAVPDDAGNVADFSRDRFHFSFARCGTSGLVLVRTDVDGSAETFDPAAVQALREMRLQSNFVYVSPRGRFVAAGLSPPGSDWTTLHLWDFSRHVLLRGTFPETMHPVVTWLADETAFFYNLTRKQFGREGYADGVYRHEINGTDSSDAIVFEHPEADGHAALPVLAEACGFLLIKTLDFVTQKAGLFAHALGDDRPTRRLLAPLAAFNVLGECDGEILLETTLNAPNGRVLAIDPRGGGSREIVCEQADAFLAIASHATGAVLGTLSNRILFVTYVRQASHCVQTFDLAGRALGSVALPPLCTVIRVAHVEGGVEILLSTFTARKRRFLVRARDAVVESGGEETLHVPCRIRQIWATSADGTRVPAFVIAPKGQERGLPTLLYGYGGWGQSLTPSFRTDLAVWLALGGAYVVANIRGGGEFGETWHDSGARLNKVNCIEDFCAVAQALIHGGITSPAQLAVRGLSNGGLLVAASVNRHPELFAAASVRVPLVDVVHLRDLPAGAALARELGDPQQDIETFSAICAYSPLQNVRASPQRPAVLVIAADRDERLPRGWTFRYVAALQATCMPDQCVLMRLVEGEGHVGWPVDVERDVMADELAFLWSTVSAESQII